MSRGGDPVTVAAGLEAQAGAVPFRLDLGLDVLPVETRAVGKRPLADPPDRLRAYHRHLYASYGKSEEDLDDVVLYETVDVGSGDAPTAVAESIDACVWVAVLVPRGVAASPDQVRSAIAGRTLSLGIVPAPEDPPSGHLPPGA